MKPLKKLSALRPYTKKELADLYEVSDRCFSTMLKPFEQFIGKKKGWYYNVNQVTVIFQKLGYPAVLLSDAYQPKFKVDPNQLPLFDYSPVAQPSEQSAESKTVKK
ncbi:MAG: hypothetical protein AB1540_17535 [Bdellovibrionota bacterium]